jgi:ribosomal protein L37AE/L43A
MDVDDVCAFCGSTDLARSGRGALCQCCGARSIEMPTAPARPVSSLWKCPECDMMMRIA